MIYITCVILLLFWGACALDNDFRFDGEGESRTMGIRTSTVIKKVNVFQETPYEYSETIIEQHEAHLTALKAPSSGQPRSSSTPNFHSLPRQRMGSNDADISAQSYFAGTMEVRPRRTYVRSPQPLAAKRLRKIAISSSPRWGAMISRKFISGGLSPNLGRGGCQPTNRALYGADLVARLRVRVPERSFFLLLFIFWGTSGNLWWISRVPCNLPFAPVRERAGVG
jgi:hypothetical protein